MRRYLTHAHIWRRVSCALRSAGACVVIIVTWRYRVANAQVGEELLICIGIGVVRSHRLRAVLN